MTEEEFVAAARARFHEIHSLEKKHPDSFYDYEVAYAEIWKDLGRQILESMISNPNQRPAKKKSIVTTFGSVSIRTAHGFSRCPFQFNISPRLQELMAYGAQLDCYEQSSDTLKQMTGLQLGAVQIWRVADCYGKGMGVHNTETPTRSLTPLRPDQMLYVEADGSMILTRNGNGWKEVKLGRIFKSSDCLHPDGKAGWVSNSQYMALLGNSTAFIESMDRLLADYNQPQRRMIFITDGAPWLRDWIGQHYPQATSILDYYHAAEHLHAFSAICFKHHRDAQAGPSWAGTQKALLLNSGLDAVLKNIEQVAGEAGTGTCLEAAESLISYYKSNRDRMDYAQYRKLGCGLIGSGAIESGHRTVIQQRMKRSGQRWSEVGAQHMLNLRVVRKNKQWARVIDLASSQKFTRAA